MLDNEKYLRGLINDPFSLSVNKYLILVRLPIMALLLLTYGSRQNNIPTKNIVYYFELSQSEGKEKERFSLCIIVVLEKVFYTVSDYARLLMVNNNGNLQSIFIILFFTTFKR